MAVDDEDEDAQEKDTCGALCIDVYADVCVHALVSEQSWNTTDPMCIYITYMFIILHIYTIRIPSTCDICCKFIKTYIYIYMHIQYFGAW